MKKTGTLLNEYRFSGYSPMVDIKGIFGDPKARLIRLKRIQKKRFADIAARHIGAITTRRHGTYGIYPVEMRGYIWKQKFGEFCVRSVGR